MTPSEAVRNFVGFAKDIFGVGDGEYELRNHDGMGFCWGSATLAGVNHTLSSSLLVVAGENLSLPCRKGSGLAERPPLDGV